MGVDGVLRTIGFERSLTEILMVLGLFLGRMIPIVTFNPFLGGKKVPNNVRVGFSLVLFALFYKFIMPPEGVSFTTYQYIFLLIKEIIFGFAIGFLSGIIFYAFIAAGRLIDTSSGYAMISTIAPELQENVSVTGQLQLQLSIVIFFLVDGHRLFLKAIAESFNIVPLLKFPDFSKHLGVLIDEFAFFSAKSIEIAVLMAFPVVISVLFSDIFFGILNRVSPQINVFFLSMPFRAMVAVTVLFFTIPFIVLRMKGFIGDMIHELNVFFSFFT